MGKKYEICDELKEYMKDRLKWVFEHATDDEIYEAIDRASKGENSSSPLQSVAKNFLDSIKVDIHKEDNDAREKSIDDGSRENAGSSN